MAKFVARLLPLLLCGQIAAGSAIAQQRDRAPDLRLGDAIVTGFSGVLPPAPGRPLPPNKSATDLTFIDPDGPSARVVDVSKPGAVWDGAVLPAPKPFDVLAKDVGQVFGIALDDAPQPNIYLGSTSLFGLNIVSRGRDGQPERRKKGGPGAGWMAGQFGLDLQGSPGAIYKIDGRTGAPTLFANVTLDGVPNPGPGLGNLAYDAAHKQLFVSDLYTGMIHRFDLDGKELDRYDHGVTGLTAAKLAPVAFDPRNRPNIGSDRFDSERPNTWGYAPPARRVWGLAVHQDRLYYSVTSGPQIWSVGIARDGRFANDPRWELDIPAQAGPLPVSDIAFSNKGAMILAQRALTAGSYDYSSFTQPGEPRVFRVWLKGPQDPPSPGRWKMIPEEYAVGFAGNHRNTNGGVALGYGYGRDGAIDSNACEFSLWTTGQNLRNAPALRARLDPGGPLVVHGLQGLPASPVRDINTPPWLSYTVAYGDRTDNPRATGHLGSVRIYAKPCVSPMAYYGGPGYPATSPYTSTPSFPPICVGPNCGSGAKIDISIKKTAGPVTFDSSTGTWSVTFTLTVKNTGMSFSPGSNISVSDAIPAGMTLVTASGTGWNCTGANCSYAFGSGTFGAGNTLPPVSVTLKTNTPGTYTNCATTALSSFPESTLANNKDCATIKALQPVDIKVDKTANYLGAANWGYTLQVSNFGTSFTTTGGAITITDVVPAGMTFGTITAPGWSCDSTGPYSAGATLTCTWIAGGTFPNGIGPFSPITITTTRTGPGPWVNCGVVAISTATDTDLSNNTSCASVPGAPIDVSINKTGTTSTDPNDPNYTYQLTVNNVGGSFNGFNTLVVTDTPPPGMTFTLPPAVTSANWDCGLSTPTALSCKYIGTTAIAAGPSLIDVFTISAVGSPTPLTIMTNCASVGLNGGLTDTNTADNNSCVTLNKTPGGFDVVKKVQNNTNGVLPSTTPYTVKVACFGYAPVTFTLTDGGPAYTVTGIAQGTSCTVSEPGPMPVVPASFCNTGYIPVWATETYSPLNPVSVSSGPQTVTVQNTLDCMADTSIGTVDVTKVVVDNTGTGLLPPTWPYTINFVCNPPNASSSASLVFPGGGTQTKVNIPVTSSCYVQEVPPAVPPGVCPLGSSGVWTVSPSGPSPSVTIVAGPGSSGTLTVTNTLNCVPDVLTVAKVVVNNTLATTLPANTYPVQVVCGSDAPLSANFTASGTQTLTPTTPGGSCNATESLSGLAVPANACPSNVTPVWSNNLPLSSSVTAPGTLTVINTLDCPPPPVGTLYVLKRVHYNNAIGTMPIGTTYLTTVSCSTPLNLVDGSPQTVLNIPYGTSCSVDEPVSSQPPIPAGVCAPGSTPVWSAPLLTPPALPATNISTPFTMFFVDNTLTCVPDAPTTGNVDVVKNLVNNTGTPVPPVNYPLTLTCSGTNWSVPAPPGIPQTISGITVGADCSVSETPIPVPPGLCTGGKVASWTVMSPSANVNPVVAGPASSGTLTFTNQLDCACPTGTVQNAGGSCDPVIICLPPNVMNAAGVCEPPPICQPPMVMNAAGVCSCPPPNVTNAAGVCEPPPICLPPNVMNAAGVCEPPPICLPPMVMNAAGVCSCPPGTTQNAGGTCDPTPICQPPMVTNAAGVCSCPPGTTQNAGGTCDPVTPVCTAPMVQNAAGACVCPPPMVMQQTPTNVCVCPSPMVMGPAGVCIYMPPATGACPAGLQRRGAECVRPPIACRAPLVPNAAGTDCVCRGRLVLRGGKCVEPVVCRPPAYLNRSGTACDCPEGYIKQGNSCERRRPAVTPDDVIRVLPGLIGPGGGGRGGDGGGSRGGDRGGGGSPAGVR